jgi:hypothetical protein
LKLNWRDVGEVENISLKDEWGYVVQEIPYFEWNSYFKKRLLEKVNRFKLK